MPTNVATLSPTLRAITSSTKDTTHTTETIDDIILSTVDDINGDNIFIVEIVVTISVLQNNDNNNQTFNNTMIKSIIEDQIFPDTNLTNLDINIDTKEEDIIVNMTISIGNKQELTRLNGYLKTNLTIDLMNNIQESLPRNTQILEIHYQIHIKEIYIEESSDDSLEDLDENDQDLSSLIPLNEETVLYIVIAAISLCFCSFILCICILCRYCKLRHKIKVIENRDRGKTGSILSIQGVKPQKIVKRSDVDGCDGYNASNQNKLGRTSTIDECLECENPIALIHEIEELKRLSESRNAHELPSVSGNHRTSPGSGSGSGSGSKSNPSNPSGSGDMDELSLGTHVIHTSEGLGGEKLQSMNDLDEIDALDDDLDDERCHILALPSLHAVESAKSVNSNISDTTFIIRNLSNLNMLNQSSNHSNLDIMIEDQIKVTNRYSSNNENLDIKDDNDWNDEDEDDDDDLAELHSMDSSSNEAMYDEGLRRGSSINPTKKGSSTMSRVKKIHGLPPPHQSMQ